MRSLRLVSAASSVCLLFAVLAAPVHAQLSVVQPGFRAELVAPGLPTGVKNLTGGTDGFLYLVTDLGSGDLGPGDHEIHSVDRTTGAVALRGKVAFSNPATSDLYRIVQGPGGSLTSKLYLVDWIAGLPVRVDRVDTNVSDPETVFSNTNGNPVGTLTSSIAFSTGAEYLEAGYFGAQGGGGPVWSFGTVTGAPPSSWASPPGGTDVRGLAFGLGGGFGTDLHVAQSTVLNGFDDAPGAILRLQSDGAGNYAGSTVLVSEASGLLEFGIEIAFDPGVLLGGDLLYLQADGRLMRVEPSGGVRSFATGVRTMYFAPDGTLYLVDGATRDLLRVVNAPVPSLSRPALIVLCGALMWAMALALGRHSAARIDLD